MSDNRQELIFADLVAEAVRIKNGVLVVEFKIHQGGISLAEVISERKKLG